MLVSQNAGYWIAEVTKTSVAAAGEEWESNSIIALHRLCNGRCRSLSQMCTLNTPCYYFDTRHLGVAKNYTSNMYDILRTINQYFYFIYKYFFPLCKIFFKIKIQ